MKGWKTKLAGVAGILLGVGQIVKAVTDGDWQAGQRGLEVVLAGLAVLGIGHKIDKMA